MTPADGGADGIELSVREPLPRRPLSLRARIIIAITAGACLLSTVLSVSTYVVVRHALVQQRESLAQRQAFVNAKLVRSGLRLRNPEIVPLLNSLENPTGSEAILRAQDQWYVSDEHLRSDSLPVSFRDEVLGGNPAVMRFTLNHATYLAVGIPIPATNASYFEVSRMDEIDDTMRVVAWSLLVASLSVSLAAAALGNWVSRSVLRPVLTASLAAESIADGELNTRLRGEGDRDLDRLVKSFNRMVDALHKRIDRDARFASDVSHELRSPLMTLSTGVTVLQSRRSELPPRSQTALDLLSDEVQRFQRMVQDLLEISRSDAGHEELALEEVLAVEFATRVAERYERPIPVESDASVDNAVLLVDKRRMERALGNIIENADRYAGGITRMSVEAVGDRIRYVLDDEGPGIPPEERAHVFERFARGATARARASGEGTGLGLSLVAEHVRLHKGDVWVEERPGGGARFIVELPREEDV